MSGKQVLKTNGPYCLYVCIAQPVIECKPVRTSNAASS